MALNIEIPSNPLTYAPPNDFIPESKKDGKWFADYARWIVRNFYNQPRRPFYRLDEVKVGMAEETIANWSYVFGEQPNYRFKFAETTPSGNTIPAQWIPGQKITELVNHLCGVVLENIENIEIGAQNLSRDVTSKRAEMYEKLMIQFEIGQMMKEQLGDAAEFSPINDAAVKFETVEDVDEYVTKWQDKYSIMAERIAQSQMYMDDLKIKFLQAAKNQFVGNLSAILTEVIEGMNVNTVIPAYELIWDNRQDDDFNKQAMLCGYVKHDVPYQEVIQKFKNYLSEDDINEIRQIAISNTDDLTEFLQYYNPNNFCGNLAWFKNWGTENMTMSYATVYFIAPRDWRYMNGNNRFGKDRIYKINDQDIISKKGGVELKGSDVNGDYSGWDVHQATIIGNKWCVNYGYMPNTLRNFNRKTRPLLPMRILCSNMALGYGRSIVSRLRKNQDELDRLAFKIQELTGKAAGKSHVINGNKVQGMTTELISDLKSIGIYVTPGSSGEEDDPQNSQKMVEVVDMTLDPNIVQYINLRNEQKLEMEEIASVSRIAMGQQTNTIGKGVQQNTINQNSYGTAMMFWNLLQFYREVLQYNVNLKQMLYQFKDSVEESLVIGDEGSYLLKILNPREFGTQPLMVFIEVNDILDPNQKERIKSIALAQAQNGAIDVVDYIEHVELSKSANQMVAGLKYSRNKNVRKVEDSQAKASQAQMQHEANLKQQEIMGKAAVQQLADDNANWREELKALSKQLTELQKMFGANGMPPPPPPSPLQEQMAAADQPPAPQPQNQEQEMTPAQ
jgi:hypothetical protein